VAQTRKPLVIALITLTGLLTSRTASAQDPFEFVVIGDMPYGPTTGTPKVQVYPSPQYDSLIADINGTQKLGFVIHIGDIKAGDTRCDDNVYSSNLGFFNQFSRPVIYLPGDNEWTDCHRANNGTYDPISRLAFLRSTFYPNSLSLGQNKISLLRQSDDPTMSAFTPYCPGVDPVSLGCKFVENVMWTYGPQSADYKILFVGINQPGSNNNRNRTSGAFVDFLDAEFNARNAANVAWLNKAFDALYNDATIKGIVIAYQANPFERYLELGQGYVVSGYNSFITTVRDRAKNQQKQVLLVNGDTHYFRTDRPLTSVYPECLTSTPACAANTGVRLMNILRTEVFAQTDVHWTKVKIEPKNPELFIVEPQTVTANVIPYPKSEIAVPSLDEELYQSGRI
jgi:hypothetical protein